MRQEPQLHILAQRGLAESDAGRFEKRQDLLRRETLGVFLLDLVEHLGGHRLHPRSYLLCAPSSPKWLRSDRQSIRLKRFASTKSPGRIEQRSEANPPER